MRAGNGKRVDAAVGGTQSLWGKLKGAVQELAGDVVTLCSHPVYLSTVAGQTLYTGKGPSPENSLPGCSDNKNPCGQDLQPHRLARFDVQWLRECIRGQK